MPALALGAEEGAEAVGFVGAPSHATHQHCTLNRKKREDSLTRSVSRLFEFGFFGEFSVRSGFFIGRQRAECLAVKLNLLKTLTTN